MEEAMGQLLLTLGNRIFGLCFTDTYIRRPTPFSLIYAFWIYLLIEWMVGQKLNQILPDNLVNDPLML